MAKDQMSATRILFALLVCCSLSACRATADRKNASGNYSGYSNPEYLGFNKSSLYLTMPDGVKIAIDLYIPRNLQAGKKLPTILEQTRYGRSIELRRPLNWFAPQTPPRMKEFVAHGYAWVMVDVRGSGASFGTWAYPWSPDEIKDGDEIVNWIVAQPWSDGKVGSLGVSYNGESAELLLANKNPHVKAIAPMFAFWDVYPSEAFPGGIYLSWFINGWGGLNEILDRNDLAALGKNKWWVPIVVRGIPPVDGPDGRAMLSSAVAQHHNTNIAKFVGNVTYRDDQLSETAGLTDGFGPVVRDFTRTALAQGAGIVELVNPTFHKTEIEASGTPMYDYEGWYDGATTRDAIHRFLDASNPQKLIIGPWIHGGHRNVRTGNRFDEVAELLRFFDYYLKGIENGVMVEPRVTYYTMIEEKWKTAAQWPPPEAKMIPFYLGSNHALARQPVAPADADRYIVDYSVGTGRHTRWEPLIGGEISGGSSYLDYGDRRAVDRKLLTYDSAPVASDLEVTGHPTVKLFVASTATDGEFFAYLEDIDRGGRVSYVTEGELRAIDRKIDNDADHFCSLVPCHSFLRKDRAPLVPGEVVELRFDLLPTSYLFKSGHSIRLAIAGADEDHFASFPGAPPTVSIWHGESHRSCVELPVIAR